MLCQNQYQNQYQYQYVGNIADPAENYGPSLETVFLLWDLISTKSGRGRSPRFNLTHLGRPWPATAAEQK